VSSGIGCGAMRYGTRSISDARLVLLPNTFRAERAVERRVNAVRDQ
jgi:hypothetical protein